MSLTFHATFGPVRHDLSRALHQVQRSEVDSSLSDDELQSSSGLGNKKFRPILQWCEHMGLVSKQARRAHLTPTGRLVLQKDAELTREATQWFMHWHLTARGTAECWRDFVTEFLPLHTHFTRAQLEGHLDHRYGKQMNSKYIASTAGLILKTYTDNSCLGTIGVLQDLSTFFVRGEAAPSIRVFAFLLFSHYSPGETLDRESLLSEDGRFRMTAPVSTSQIEDYLDQLTTQGLVKQQRAVKPHLVTLSTEQDVDSLLAACFD